MSKITKRIFKSLLISSVLSLLNTDVKAKEALIKELDMNEDENDKIDKIKNTILKNVIKISPSGRMTAVNGHRSHSSHRSHYSGSGGGHMSHISHTSSSHSSHSSHYSSSTTTKPITPVYTPPAPKTPADYSLGDRTIKVGTFGHDVDILSDYLVDNYYLKKSAITKKSGYPLFDASMSNAIKHFQKDAGLSPSGNVDDSTISALRVWDKHKTTVELGFRDLTNGMSGYDVSQLVKLLTAAGYAPDSSKLEYDKGYVVFNKEVSMAIKVFQAYNHLEVTGIPDSSTITKLKTFNK